MWTVLNTVMNILGSLKGWSSFSGRATSSLVQGAGNGEINVCNLYSVHKKNAEFSVV